MRPAILLGFLFLMSIPDDLPAHDRPTGDLHKSRSAVLSRRGMAATSQALATAAAIRILQQGGSAVDAAIAANAVQGVVEPMSCGIGGDLFAIVWDQSSHKLHGLNASGRAPAKASIDLFRSKGLTQIPTKGPLSWSVPGCIDGWAELHKKFGKLPLDQVLAPAIEYAEKGFPVSEVIAASWKASERSLARIPTSRATFLNKEGKAPAFGEVASNPQLGKTLRAIAKDGRDAFYKGAIADGIVAYSDSVGGLFSKEDLATHTSTWIDPVSTNYRGYDVWELPPNGQGIAALQMLNMLEPYNLRSMGRFSAETMHLLIEAKKLAYEDRAKWYADPEFSKVPVKQLISKEYAKKRGELIKPGVANARPIPGEPLQADTIYLTVVDGEMNAISLIQSNFEGFGSDQVPGDLGFPLQNRGCLFALDPTHENRLEPRKRPFHTIIPGFVTKDGEPWLSFGLMGGDMQAQGHVQALVNLIDFGMDPQSAGDAARFCHYGSSTPTGIPAKAGGEVALESEIPESVRKTLESWGHVLRLSPGGYGGYQAIRIDAVRKILIGGSDPRKDGAAMGY